MNISEKYRAGLPMQCPAEFEFQQMQDLHKELATFHDHVPEG